MSNWLLEMIISVWPAKRGLYTVEESGRRLQPSVGYPATKPIRCDFV